MHHVQAAAQAMPPEHVALERSIRTIQSAYKNPIPEERFEQIISGVAPLVFLSVINASQSGSNLQDATASALVDKDTKAERIGTDQEMSRVFRRLYGTGVGKEALLRVAHAVSLTVIHNQILFRTQQLPGLDEVHISAFMFASQPLEAAINQADPHALAATRLDDVLAVHGDEHPTVEHADQPAAAPERTFYTDLEQNAIETAARLLRLIWEATQLSPKASREEKESQQRLSGEELIRITAQLAQN